jgi:hypothetical protein
LGKITKDGDPWVRIASSVRTSAAHHLEINRTHPHARTLEAMRTQAQVSEARASD